jgi:hypothetical protein
MRHTQIHFEASIFKALKERVNTLGISVSAYICNLLGTELKRQENIEQADLSSFIGIWKGRKFSRRASERKHGRGDPHDTDIPDNSIVTVPIRTNDTLLSPYPETSFPTSPGRIEMS